MRRRGFAMAVGVQDPPALHRSETCFGKPVGPTPSAKTTEASAREAVAEALAVARKIVSGSASDAPPPRLSRKLRPSPRKVSWEARRA